MNLNGIVPLNVWTFVQTVPLFGDIVAYRRGSQTLLQGFINKKPDRSKINEKHC